MNDGLAHRGLTQVMAAMVVAMAFTVGASAQVTIPPVADGTLADGSIHGPFDGTADFADWSFNESGFEGAITLARLPLPGLEYRVVFEYNLATVTATVPLSASLTFTIRGAARFPAEPARVNVHAYSADLLETLSDFSSPPIGLAAALTVAPFQPATTVMVNVNDIVNQAMTTGGRKIGFRFQIDSQSNAEAQQAFIDALDSNLATKPFLTIRNRMPSDFDNDRDIDLKDHAALTACAFGPNVSVSANCAVLDADYDSDVDLVDVRSFLNDASRYSQ